MITSAQTITQALNGHWHGTYGLCLCPAHPNTRTPALSISDGRNGRLLLHCHSGCDFWTIIDALKGLSLIDGSSRRTPLTHEELEAIKAQKLEIFTMREAQAIQCWNMAQPIEDTPAEVYLRARGITCSLGETLRFNPSCWHPSKQRLPALVALVEGAEHLAVHRTYLRSDGKCKATAEPTKAMLGSVAGGAVRLSAGVDSLIVCEGIETGLSLLSGLVPGAISVWAALSTSGMKALSLPTNPASITIATDGDEAGQQAGRVLAERATSEGWKVHLLPAPNGRDWNDILMMKRTAS